ncbi:Methyltransferase domain-containing protein [Actinopolymorpha cephalotaxi]|uniref:Methyltransferase domain-containing protein n=1 Tax=Actinopolymorpha cephalotaxi TaxID=504797 RepID=A0A1I2XDF8_9ACTN|nr:class I SAM-dependent methyltransferase [Actinopolymorpha cephalotaxi]NYH86201.1 SAM-dependent methyltransferase [Actinopolymorpha cephalotaxi]SFH11550.1 Methyltransferase domain-containing protein [Actinopolymorpha cephalotaxi]
MREYWNAFAPTFDDEPDHGLRDPLVRRAWKDLLLGVLPPSPADVLDLGCGTGSLSVLLAEVGYRVSGVDLAEQMVEAAKAKATAAGVDVRFEQGDAAQPPHEPHSFDVVLTRHVLWALPDPAGALERWVELLRPEGQLVLVEGRWETGGGIAADDCEALLRTHCRSVRVQRLDDPTFWGREISDARYLAIARP